MKKFFLQVCLIMTLANVTHGQSYDDGYVTNGLPVNVYSEKFQTYVKGLNAGIDNVGAGIIRSNDDIIQTYGIDPLRYPRLNEVIATSDWGAYDNRFSPSFLRNLQSIFSKVGKEYDNIIAVRNAFHDLPSLAGLNSYEAEALAAIDISTQEVSRRFLTSLTGTASSVSFPWKKFGNDLQPKLPSWARCVLGVLGEAILGGFSGVKLGTAVGGTVGAVIGGVIGVAGGAFAGAARYC